MPQQPPPFRVPLLSKAGIIEDETWRRWLLPTHTVITLAAGATGRVLSPDQLALVDATAGAVTVRLPVAPARGDVVTVKKVDPSGHAVTVSGNGNLIDGAATQTLATPGAALTVEGDGAAWQITGKV